MEDRADCSDHFVDGGQVVIDPRDTCLPAWFSFPWTYCRHVQLRALINRNVFGKSHAGILMASQALDWDSKHQSLGINPPITESYSHQELRTLQAVPGGGAVTQVFNYGDLPCPPVGIAAQLSPDAAYNPVLVAPFIFIHDIDNSNLTLDCNIRAIHDPAKPIAYVTSITLHEFGPPS